MSKLQFFRHYERAENFPKLTFMENNIFNYILKCEIDRKYKIEKGELSTDSDTGKVYRSNQKMGQLFGIGESTFANHLTSLKNKGSVYIHWAKGKRYIELSKFSPYKKYTTPGGPELKFFDIPSHMLEDENLPGMKSVFFAQIVHDLEQGWQFKKNTKLTSEKLGITERMGKIITKDLLKNSYIREEKHNKKHLFIDESYKNYHLLKKDRLVTKYNPSVDNEHEKGKYPRMKREISQNEKGNIQEAIPSPKFSNNKGHTPPSSDVYFLTNNSGGGNVLAHPVTVAAQLVREDMEKTNPNFSSDDWRRFAKEKSGLIRAGIKGVQADNANNGHDSVASNH